jgi:hypothetical protein
MNEPVAITSGVARALVVVLALAGCSGVSRPPPAESLGTPAGVRLPARAAFTVVPAELGDAGVLERIHHRARLRRIGNAWIDPLAEPLSSHERDDIDLALPVIAEVRQRLRVVTLDSDRSARIAMWIDRDDTWKVITTPLALADPAGNPRTIWLALGAPVTVEGALKSDLVPVRVRDEAMQIEGHAPRATIANVWLAPSGAHDGDADGISVPGRSEPNKRYVALVAGTRIRDARGMEIATVTGEDVEGEVLADRGDTLEVEIERPYARIRGVVRVSDTTAVDQLSGFGTMGTGSGFGMSHADRIELPPTTCLFAEINGEVAGVQLATSTRLGRVKTASPSWSMVYVGTRWGIAKLYVHDVGDDPKQPRWESCADPTSGST